MVKLFLKFILIDELCYSALKVPVIPLKSKPNTV